MHHYGNLTENKCTVHNFTHTVETCENKGCSKKKSVPTTDGNSFFPQGMVG